MGVNGYRVSNVILSPVKSLPFPGKVIRTKLENEWVVDGPPFLSRPVEYFLLSKSPYSRVLEYLGVR